jgi:hypothetical protein
VLKISKSRTNRTRRDRGWDPNEHNKYVYDVFSINKGVFQENCLERGNKNSRIREELTAWNADLGARDRMDWKGFERRHHYILGKLSKISRLGKLDPSQVTNICDVVYELDKFKNTETQTLVFGSKAAHFHFPGTIPVMSSEVRTGLVLLEKLHPAELHDLIPSPAKKKFRFGTQEKNYDSYWYYVALGNAMMRKINDRDYLRRKSTHYQLHAKVFEWWVISFGLK